MKFCFLLLSIFALTFSGCGFDWFPVATISDISFSPAAVTDVTGGATVTSSSLTIAMKNTASASIGVSGDTSSKYSINGATATSAPGTVKDGDKVTVQHAAARNANGVVTTTLTVGTKVATFSSTTSANSTVSAFSFPPGFSNFSTSSLGFNNVSTNTVVISKPTTISITGAAAKISVTGVATSKYLINALAFTNLTGTVINGDQITVQHNSGSARQTKVVTRLTITGTTGAQFANFSSTTK